MDNLIYYNGCLWEKVYSALNYCKFHGMTRFIAVIPHDNGNTGISCLKKICEKCKEEDELNEEVRD